MDKQANAITITTAQNLAQGSLDKKASLEMNKIVQFKIFRNYVM